MWRRKHSSFMMWLCSWSGRVQRSTCCGSHGKWKGLELLAAHLLAVPHFLYLWNVLSSATSYHVFRTTSYYLLHLILFSNPKSVILLYNNHSMLRYIVSQSSLVNEVRHNCPADAAYWAISPCPPPLPPTPTVVGCILDTTTSHLALFICLA